MAALTYLPMTRELGAQELHSSPCTWMGYTVVEWTGDYDGTLEIWDGNPAGGGTRIGTLYLAGAESVTKTFGRKGVAITSSLWIDNTQGATGGAFIGSLFIK